MNWKDFIKHFYIEESFLTFVIGDIKQGPPGISLPESKLDWVEKYLDGEVFFTPAPTQEETNKALKKNRIGTRVLWVDIDEPKEPVSFPLPPTFVVSSGKGLHVYWVISELLSSQKAEQLNKILAGKTTGADNSAWNINRYLRVPSSKNLKYVDGPPVLLTGRGDSSLVWTPEEISLLGRLDKKITDKFFNPSYQGFKSRSELDFFVVRKLLAAGYDHRSIRKIFEYSPIGKKYKEDGQRYLDTTIKNAEASLDNTKEAVSEKAGGNQLFEQGNAYWYQSNRGVSKISNFILRPKIILRDRTGEDIIVATAVSELGYEAEMILPRSAFNSKNQFAKYNTFVNFSFWGNDFVFSLLLPFLISENIEIVKESTSVVGLHEAQGEFYYVTPHQVISKEGILNNLEAPINFSLNLKEKPDLRRLTDDSFSKEKLLEILNINKRESVLLFLGWYAGTLVKEYLWQNDLRFPVLSVAGTHGSGKTTLIRLFMELFGQIPKTYYASTTNFVLLSLMGSSNTFPVAISEFRYSGGARILSILLMGYDSGKDARGTADQRTIEYPLTATFTLDGEDFLRDPAAKERIIVISLRKAHARADSPYYKSFKGFEIPHSFVANFMQYILNNLEKSIQFLHEAYEEFDQYFPIGIPERVRHNHCAVHMGNRLFFDFMGVPCPDITYVEESLQYLVNMKTGSPKLNIDIFIEDTLSYISSGTARFKFQTSDSYILFAPVGAHNQWVIDSRRMGRPTFEQDAIFNQLQDIDYVISEFKEGAMYFKVDIEKARQRGLLIDNIGFGL